MWDRPVIDGKLNDSTHFVVYASDSDDAESVISDSENIIAVVYGNSLILEGALPSRIYITALNRVNNESAPVMVKVK